MPLPQPSAFREDVQDVATEESFDVSAVRRREEGLRGEGAREDRRRAPAAQKLSAVYRGLGDFWERKLTAASK